MSYIFTPPTTDGDPPYLPESSALQKRLFRFYKARPYGLNVFKLSDGTYVTSQEVVPYPWDPNDPSAPYARSIYAGKETDSAHTVWIEKVYFGGHENPISDAEEVELVAAGYGAYITGTP